MNYASVAIQHPPQAWHVPRCQSFRTRRSTSLVAGKTANRVNATNRQANASVADITSGSFTACRARNRASTSARNDLSRIRGEFLFTDANPRSPSGCDGGMKSTAGAMLATGRSYAANWRTACHHTTRRIAGMASTIRRLALLTAGPSFSAVPRLARFIRLSATVSAIRSRVASPFERVPSSATQSATYAIQSASSSSSIQPPRCAA